MTCHAERHIASCLASLRGSKAPPKRFLNNVQAWLRALSEGENSVGTFRLLSGLLCFGRL